MDPCKSKSLTTAVVLSTRLYVWSSSYKQSACWRCKRLFYGRTSATHNFTRSASNLCNSAGAPNALHLLLLASWTERCSSRWQHLAFYGCAFLPYSSRKLLWSSGFSQIRSSKAVLFASAEFELAELPYLWQDFRSCVRYFSITIKLVLQINTDIMSSK